MKTEKFNEQMEIVKEYLAGLPEEEKDLHDIDEIEYLIEDLHEVKKEKGYTGWSSKDYTERNEDIIKLIYKKSIIICIKDYQYILLNKKGKINFLNYIEQRIEDTRNELNDYEMIHSVIGECMDKNIEELVF